MSDIFRSDSDSLRLASALELYGSIISAIHNKENDKVDLKNWSSD